MISLNRHASFPEDIKSILVSDPNITPLMLVKKMLSKQQVMLSSDSISLIGVLERLVDLKIINSSDRGLLLHTFQGLSNKTTLATQCIDFLNTEIAHSLDLEILIYEWIHYDYNVLQAFIEKKLQSLPENALDIFFSVLLCKDNDEHQIKQKILVILKNAYWSNPTIKTKCNHMFQGVNHNPPRFVQLLKPARDLQELTSLHTYSLGALAMMVIIEQPILKELLSYRNEDGHNIIKIFHDSQHMHSFVNLFLSNFIDVVFKKPPFLESLLFEVDSEMKNLFFQLYHPHKNSLEYLIDYLQKNLTPTQFKSILFKAFKPNALQNLIAHDIQEKIIRGRGQFKLLLKHCFKLDHLQRTFILNQNVLIGERPFHFLCIPFAMKTSRESNANQVFNQMFSLLSSELPSEEWKDMLQQSVSHPKQLLSFCTRFHPGLLQEIFRVVGPMHWNHAMLVPDESHFLTIEKACLVKDFSDMSFLIQNLKILTDKEKLLMMQHENYRLILLIPRKFLHLFFNQMLPTPQNQNQYFQHCIKALEKGINQFQDLKSRFSFCDGLLALETTSDFLCNYLEHLSHIQNEGLHIKLSEHMLSKLSKRIVMDVCFSYFITMMNASSDSWSFLKFFIAKALKNMDFHLFTQAWLKDNHEKNTVFMDELNTLTSPEQNGSLSHPGFF